MFALFMGAEKIDQLNESGAYNVVSTAARNYTSTSIVVLNQIT